MKNFRLDDETIQELFGVDDAENEKPERLKAFFIKNKAYENLRSNLPIRIVVGHKGIGKSALLKMCHLEDMEQNKPTIWVKPDQFLDIAYNNDFNEMISSWKRQLRSLIVGEFIGLTKNESTNSITGSIISDLLEKAKDHAPNTKKAILDSLEKNRSISIYIDDLDRGWQAKPEDVSKISTLLNAIRDLSGDNPNIKFVVGLRTDVYHLVRTSDESTDKIEQNIINLHWRNHEILFLMARRIHAFFGAERIEPSVNMVQRALFKYFDPVIEEKFTGSGKWINAPMYMVLLSLTRERPRDLIKLLSSAAKRAFSEDRNKITTSDLKSIFDSYSQERMQDLINEFKSELPEVKNLLFGMRPTKRERTTLVAFSYDKAGLISKIDEIVSHNSFFFATKTMATPMTLAEFLYRIDFITARLEKEDEKPKHLFYKDNKNLMGREDFGFKWEVHPAYRWALQPTDIDSIFDSINLDHLDI